MKAADARKFIPSELRLVELFGHVPTMHFWDSGAFTTLFLRLRGKTHCLLKVFVLRRYTLGGVFLARYSHSPVGAFDEVMTAPVLVNELLAQARARPEYGLDLL